MIHLRTEHLGPDDLLVAAKVALARRTSVDELAGAIDAVEARLRERVPKARVVYFEPDVYRPGERRTAEAPEVSPYAVSADDGVGL